MKLSGALLALALGLAVACGVKAPPRPSGAPDRAPPPGVFTPAPAAGPGGGAAPVNAAPAPAVPCERSGEETCR